MITVCLGLSHNDRAYINTLDFTVNGWLDHVVHE